MAKFHIAIDGPASSGKSSTAYLLSQRLNFMHINSGEIYRCLTYIIIKYYNNTINKEIEIKYKHGHFIYKNIRILKENIHNNTIDNNVSYYAGLPSIREKVNNIMHDIIKNTSNGIIIDGRDIGTRVLPHAELKIYLEASPEVRAKRRFIQRSDDSSIEEILEDIKERDRKDTTREIDPLRVATDAIIINTDNLTLEEQVDKIYNIYHLRIKD